MIFILKLFIFLSMHRGMNGEMHQNVNIWFPWRLVLDDITFSPLYVPVFLRFPIVKNYLYNEKGV